MIGPKLVDAIGNVLRPTWAIQKLTNPVTSLQDESCQIGIVAWLKTFVEPGSLDRRSLHRNRKTSIPKQLNASVKFYSKHQTWLHGLWRSIKVVPITPRLLIPILVSLLSSCSEAFARA